MVNFCDNCGAIIMGKKNENVTCPSCGQEKKGSGLKSLKQKIKKKQEKEIVNPQDDTKVLPTTTVECPKCGHNKAHYWTKQVRASDEPESQYFRCQKCKHQWRDDR